MKFYDAVNMLFLNNILTVTMEEKWIAIIMIILTVPPYGGSRYWFPQSVFF